MTALPRLTLILMLAALPLRAEVTPVCRTIAAADLRAVPDAEPTGRVPAGVPVGIEEYADQGGTALVLLTAARGPLEGAYDWDVGWLPETALACDAGDLPDAIGLSNTEADPDLPCRLALGPDQTAILMPPGAMLELKRWAINPMLEAGEVPGFPWPLRLRAQARDSFDGVTWIAVTYDPADNLLGWVEEVAVTCD